MLHAAEREFRGGRSMDEELVAGTAKAPAKVLVVDDEDAVSGAIERLLSSAGFEVVVARSGTEAIALITATSFDVILSDIHMPKLDGVQLLRLIRLRDLDVPVLLMTGQPHISTATRAIALGALQYLIKPVSPGTLVATVKRAARLSYIARIRRDAFRLVNGPYGSSVELGEQTQLDRGLSSMWMAFQPIVRTEGNAAYAFEALLRSGEVSLPNPPAIIEAAERLGRLADVGRSVRRAVAAAIPDAPKDALVFVNLHARDLMDEDLYSPSAPLSAFASRVVLEITERASLHDINDVRDRVSALRSLGYRIAVDDLGAGYSGLSAFASLEPDLVKLDMSLVRDIDSQPVKQKLVAALITVCRDLEILAVAEGVETEAERRVLVDLGCPLLQGYLFGKPARGFVLPAAR
jgi:EAL domain-containing protein (putative c-di-GMP-specific phosphodiesterase class I)/CheY-like chemotaxis protein